MRTGHERICPTADLIENRAETKSVTTGCQRQISRDGKPSQWTRKTTSYSLMTAQRSRISTMTPVIVVGAGCFGAWTAYQLARSGRAVTLIDAYSPGNSRASSGGETRVIRMSYGDQEIYTRWSWRSLELWKALFERADPTLFHETGVLWMAREQDTL